MDGRGATSVREIVEAKNLGVASANGRPFFGALSAVSLVCISFQAAMAFALLLVPGSC